MFKIHEPSKRWTLFLFLSSCFLFFSTKESNFIKRFIMLISLARPLSLPVKWWEPNPRNVLLQEIVSCSLGFPCLSIVLSYLTSEIANRCASVWNIPFAQEEGSNCHYSMQITDDVFIVRPFFSWETLSWGWKRQFGLLWKNDPLLRQSCYMVVTQEPQQHLPLAYPTFIRMIRMRPNKDKLYLFNVPNNITVLDYDKRLVDKFEIHTEAWLHDFDILDDQIWFASESGFHVFSLQGKLISHFEKDRSFRFCAKVKEHELLALETSKGISRLHIFAHDKVNQVLVLVDTGSCSQRVLDIACHRDRFFFCTARSVFVLE